MNTKKLTALLLAIVLVLSMALTACSKPETQEEPEAPAENTETEAPAAEPEAEQTQEPDASAEAQPCHHMNAHGFASYSVHSEKAEDGTVSYSYMDRNGQLIPVDPAEIAAAMEKVVAACGEMQLTNRELAFYYEQTYYSVIEAYSSYIMYIMNPDLALDEQLSLDNVSTWQQLLLENALIFFNRTAALYQEAEAAGFVLSDAEQAELDEIVEKLHQEGNASGASEEDMKAYEEFLRKSTVAAAYYNELASAITYTDQDLSDYYDVNAAAMEQQRIFKTDKNVVHVRHILITPEDTESEDSWTAAETQANDLLAQWQAGEATEDAFAALANEHSTDPGSNTNGGLYEEVYHGQMVTEFDEWCFADGRQVGDTGVVKTSYGYHIMFFSGEGDYVYWKEAVASQYINAVANSQLNEIMGKYPQSSSRSDMVILDPTAPTAPAAEEETAAE